MRLELRPGARLRSQSQVLLLAHVSEQHRPAVAKVHDAPAARQQRLAAPPPTRQLLLQHSAPQLQLACTAPHATASHENEPLQVLPHAHQPQLKVPPQPFGGVPHRPEQVSGVQPHAFAVPPPPQVCGQVQAPQLDTVRAAPQLSVPERLPQAAPRRVQNAASLSCVQPHAFAVPPPPQVCGQVQVPQLDTVRPAPQLSVPERPPQVAPRRVQNAASLSCVQPHTFAVPPPPQVCGQVQVPQLDTVRAAPQLSVPERPPQVAPRRVQNAASLSCVQPQTFVAPPPPQVRGRVQVPQLETDRASPQLSVPERLPQVAPRRAQKTASVSAVHTPQTLGTVWPHRLAGVQVPQLATDRG